MWKLDIKIMFAESQLKAEDTLWFDSPEEADNYIMNGMFVGDKKPDLIVREHGKGNNLDIRICGSHGKLLVTMRLHKVSEPPKEIG